MTCCLWYWIAGYGRPAVVSATSVGSMNWAVVGRRPIDVTIASAETDPGGTGFFDDFGGVTTGQ